MKIEHQSPDRLVLSHRAGWIGALFIAVGLFFAVSALGQSGWTRAGVALASLVPLLIGLSAVTTRTRLTLDAATGQAELARTGPLPGPPTRFALAELRHAELAHDKGTDGETWCVVLVTATGPRPMTTADSDRAGHELGVLAINDWLGARP